MAVTSSPNSLGPQERGLLCAVARESIVEGLRNRQPLEPRPAHYPEPLQRERACFVSLHQNDALRGCMGTLVARRPLILECAMTAYNAAFSDPRFPALRHDELELTEISLSVLSPPEPLAVRSERELLEALRPGMDGVILREGVRTGTFLPAVWESIPDPQAFVQHLKQKAGLPPQYWSETLEIYRYGAESFSEGSLAAAGGDKAVG